MASSDKTPSVYTRFMYFFYTHFYIRKKTQEKQQNSKTTKQQNKDKLKTKNKNKDKKQNKNKQKEKLTDTVYRGGESREAANPQGGITPP